MARKKINKQSVRPTQYNKSKTKGKVKKPQVISSMGPSYDTQMIVTILLLIFIYPLGLVFMWAWMRSWPIWVKIAISLPLIISIFFVTLILFAVGKVLRTAKYNQMIYQYQQQITPSQQNNMYGNPTTPSYKTY